MPAFMSLSCVRALPLLIDSELQESILTVCFCQQTSIQLLQHFTFYLQWSLILCQLSFNLNEEIVLLFLFQPFPSSYHLYAALSSTASLFMQGFSLKFQHSLRLKLVHAACLLCFLGLLANHTFCYRSHLLLADVRSQLCCSDRLLMVSILVQMPFKD